MSTPTPTPTAAEKARLRREKMQRSSEARMAKILGAEPGRQAPALDSPVASDKRVASQSIASNNAIEASAPTAAATQTPSRATKVADVDDDDPEEVDISTIHAPAGDEFSYVQQRQRMLQQMMMGGMPNDARDPFGGQSPFGPGAQNAFGAGAQNPFGPGGGDPFAMLQQMMGDNPMAQQQPVQESADTKWWTVLHIACVIVLVLLIPASSVPTYGATRPAAHIAGRGVGWFWYFINLEIVLQTARFFIAGPKPTGGILATIGNFLPPPYQGYVWSLARYALIWTSLRDDFCLLIVGLVIRSIISGGAG